MVYVGDIFIGGCLVFLGASVLCVQVVWLSAYRCSFYKLQGANRRSTADRLMMKGEPEHVRIRVRCAGGF